MCKAAVYISGWRLCLLFFYFFFIVGPEYSCNNDTHIQGFGFSRPSGLSRKPCESSKVSIHPGVDNFLRPRDSSVWVCVCTVDTFPTVIVWGTSFLSVSLAAAVLSTGVQRPACMCVLAAC